MRFSTIILVVCLGSTGESYSGGVVRFGDDHCVSGRKLINALSTHGGRQSFLTLSTTKATALSIPSYNSIWVTASAIRTTALRAHKGGKFSEYKRCLGVEIGLGRAISSIRLRKKTWKSDSDRILGLCAYIGTSTRALLTLPERRTALLKKMEIASIQAEALSIKGIEPVNSSYNRRTKLLKSVRANFEQLTTLVLKLDVT